jgi:hypothetical protein
MSNNDYITRTRRFMRNRGHDDSPESIGRQFATSHQEHRAQVLDGLDSEDPPELTTEDMGAELERSKYLSVMRRVHHSLRRQGR